MVGGEPMKESGGRRKWICIARGRRMGRWWAFSGLTMVVAWAAVAQPNILPNGDFTDGVATWSHSGDPSIELAWDPTLGDPLAGSLRLFRDSATSDLGSAEALSPCFDTVPGAVYELRRRTLATGTDSSIRCRVFLNYYEGENCTGERTGFGFGAMIPADAHDIWQNRAGRENAVSSPSFRVSLLASFTTVGGTASCNFDSIILSDAAADVPAISPLGLVVLIGLIALTGTTFLLKRS